MCIKEAKVRKRLICTLAMLALAVSSVSAGDFWNLFGSHRGIRGSGNRVTETREIEDFDKIESKGSFDVVITAGEELGLEITFDDNLIDLIQTDVRGNTLRLGADENYNSRRSCRIDITVPSIERVKLSGSGDIFVMNLENEYFEFYLSGSGDLRAEGRTDELVVHVSGSGNIDTRDLKAKYVETSVSGSGDVKVYAAESFTGRISGSGDIDVYGNPPQISKRVSGSGDISRR